MEFEIKLKSIHEIDSIGEIMEFMDVMFENMDTYTIEKINENGNLFYNFITKMNFDKLNKIEVLDVIEEINQIRLRFKELSNKNYSHNLSELDNKIGNFIIAVKGKYLEN